MGRKLSEYKNYHQYDVHLKDEYKRAVEEAITVIRDVVEGYVGGDEIAQECEDEIREQLLQ